MILRNFFKFFNVVILLIFTIFSEKEKNHYENYFLQKKTTLSKCCQCEQEVIETCIQWNPIPSFHVIRKYDYVECTLAIFVLHDGAKHRCNHHDGLNRIKIRLKIRRHAIPTTKFVVDHAVESTPACNVTLRIFKGMEAEMRDHVVANIVELFVQILIILQKTRFLDSLLVTWLYDL